MDVGEFTVAGEQVRAEIARVTAPAPASGSDDLFVIVNSFDGGRAPHGPCMWEPPAGGLPQVGELCVVLRAIEEDGEGEQTVVVAFDRDALPSGGGASGPAGGALSGTYPNPGFAADMATQAELNAAVAASVNDGDAAGGDLGGTYPGPNVVRQTVNDTRFAGTAPGDYDSRGYLHFKQRNAIGNPGGSSGFATLFGARGWTDDSGGNAHEVAYTDVGIYYRTGTESGGWGAWGKVSLQTDLDGHAADTTAVHGIADTAALVVDGDPAGGDLAGTYPNPTLGGTYKTAFPFAAGWGDLGGFEAANYSRIGRLVVLHGVVTKTSGLPAAGNVIGTLPAGFRPAGTLAFAQGLQDGFSANRIDVLSNGGVVWQSGGASETDYAVLNGISFITA